MSASLSPLSLFSGENSFNTAILVKQWLQYMQVLHHWFYKTKNRTGIYNNGTEQAFYSEKREGGHCALAFHSHGTCIKQASNSHRTCIEQAIYSHRTCIEQALHTNNRICIEQAFYSHRTCIDQAF